MKTSSGLSEVIFPGMKALFGRLLASYLDGSVRFARTAVGPYLISDFTVLQTPVMLEVLWASWNTWETVRRQINVAGFLGDMMVWWKYINTSTRPGMKTVIIIIIILSFHNKTDLDFGHHEWIIWGEPRFFSGSSQQH